MQKNIDLKRLNPRVVLSKQGTRQELQADVRLNCDFKCGIDEIVRALAVAMGDQSETSPGITETLMDRIRTQSHMHYVRIDGEVFEARKNDVGQLVYVNLNAEQEAKKAA